MTGVISQSAGIKWPKKSKENRKEVKTASMTGRAVM
jgi:hypothetical protein